MSVVTSLKKKDNTVLTEKKVEQLSNIEIFKSEGLIVDTDPDYCAKKAPGKLGKKINLFTNFFGLKPTNTVGTKVYQYEIEISKVFENGKTAIINKKREVGSKTNDYFEQISKQSLINLWAAFGKVLENHDLGEYTGAITDFNRLLYLLNPIHSKFTTVENPKEVFSLTLEKHEFPEKINEKEIEGVAKIVYNLKFTTSFDPYDSLFSNDILDRDGFQYLALLTSMKVSLDKMGASIYENGKNFLKDPKMYGFEEPPKLNDGKYLGVGLQKTIRLMEGQSNNAGIALSIDIKKAAFHDSITLDKKFDELLSVQRGHNTVKLPFSGSNAQKVINNIKGLACHLTHLKDKTKTIIVSGISTETPDKKIIDVDGKKVNVAQYYQTKYNITLKRKDLPLVEQKTIFNKEKRISYYPMELLMIAPYQRVKQKAQTPEQISSMIKECATAPKKRLNEIHNLFASLQLVNNEYLKQAKIVVENKVLSAPARQLKPPTLITGNQKFLEIRNENGTWDLGRNEQFNIPSKIDNWCVVLIEGKGKWDVRMNDAKLFVDKYIQCAKMRGIKISACAEISTCPPIEQKLKELFDYLKKYDTGFVLFMTPDSVTYLHNMIKLYERETGIPTQDLKHSTVSKIIQKNQFKTLENIILKSNVKSGGHNYDLKNVIKGDRLILGIGFNHTMASEADSLSVVGYAANTRKTPSEFAGDFEYVQFSRDGQIKFYENIIKNCVQNFKSTRGIIPKEFLIYRTSGSEGRYNDYCTFDIPYIRKKLQEFAPGAKFAFVVIEKGHNIRFFKDKIIATDKAPLQNISPGSVIDQGVTNPKLCEFYLTTHSGLQGTAKTPRYTILYDNMNLSMDELQGVTNCLAYGYQIVNLPTSLPAPIYIANQYAERGRNLLNANNHKIGQKIILSDEKQATKVLAYATSKFNNLRINA
uniref:Piwi domain-containing protein n=1 Tax=Parastrongyloides trichosuri TaxID=131310 RepID=A0A0N4Z0P6_PARTI